MEFLVYNGACSIYIRELNKSNGIVKLSALAQSFYIGYSGLVPCSSNLVMSFNFVFPMYLLKQAGQVNL